MQAAQDFSSRVQVENQAPGTSDIQYLIGSRRIFFQ